MSDSTGGQQDERQSERKDSVDAVDERNEAREINESNDQPDQINLNHFKSIGEVERILEKCISIAKENQHMINETCNHIINRNRKRNKDDFDLVTVMQIGYPIYVEILSDFIENIITTTDQKKTEKLVTFLLICKELEANNKRIEQLNGELKQLILPGVNRFLDL